MHFSYLLPFGLCKITIESVLWYQFNNCRKTYRSWVVAWLLIVSTGREYNRVRTQDSTGKQGPTHHRKYLPTLKYIGIILTKQQILKRLKHHGFSYCRSSRCSRKCIHLQCVWIHLPFPSYTFNWQQWIFNISWDITLHCNNTYGEFYRLLFIIITSLLWPKSHVPIIFFLFVYYYHKYFQK